MPSRRTDFAVPHDARRARCRYCLATIYWAIKAHRGPLHAATAIRNGDGETRMESHVAHCPKRLTALAQAKTQPCPGKGCRERIVGGDAAPVLCPTCWALLPPTISAWVAREASRKPRTPDYLEAVAHARKVVGTIRAHPRPAATLFPGVEYG